MIVYFNQQYLPKDEVRLSPDDRGFLFADGIYEVVRAYRGKLFQADAHRKRLDRSLFEMRLALPPEFDYEGVALRLLAENLLTEVDAVVYLQVTRGAALRKHAFPPADTPPTVYMTAYPVRTPSETWQTGASVILQPDTRWHRCDIKSVSLLPNILANQAAKEVGADEAVFVRNGVVTEGTLSNVGAVFDGVLYTHPLTNAILAGVTRSVALRLARETGVPVMEFPVFEHELTRVDEVMLFATTLEIMPVVRIDGRAVGDGKPGPIARRLHAAFRELVEQGPQ